MYVIVLCRISIILYRRIHSVRQPPRSKLTEHCVWSTACDMTYNAHTHTLT